MHLSVLLSHISAKIIPETYIAYPVCIVNRRALGQAALSYGGT